MSDKKLSLSEKLENARAGSDFVTTCDVTEARALEERVAECEDASRAKGVGIKAFSSQLSKATARAEAAESDVARLRGEMRGRVVALRDQRDELSAKLKKVRALLDGDPGALHVVALIDGEDCDEA